MLPPTGTIRSLAAALLIVPAALSAQASGVVDEGSFTITQQGAPYGRESFRIARTPAPGGQVFRATGQGALGDSRITSTLGTDSTGVPVSYSSDLSLNSRVLQRLQGRGRPGRFSVLSSTTAGEAAREFALEGGTLLIDGDVIHHYYFVTLAEHAQVSVIAPRSGLQIRFVVAEQPHDTIEIGGRLLDSRHYNLSSSNGVRRELWVDAQGRLLKVSVPDRGLMAIRDDPPR
jgi:hypothetical protein